MAHAIRTQQGYLGKAVPMGPQVGDAIALVRGG